MARCADTALTISDALPLASTRLLDDRVPTEDVLGHAGAVEGDAQASRPRPWRDG